MKFKIFLTLIFILLIYPNNLISSDVVLEQFNLSKKIKTGLTITNLSSYPQYSFLLYYKKGDFYGRNEFRRFTKDHVPIFMEGDPFSSTSIVAIDVADYYGDGRQIVVEDTSKLIRSSIENGFTEHLPGDSLIRHIEKKFEIVAVRGRELILRPVSEVLTYKDGSIKKFTNPSSQKEEPAVSSLSRVWIFAVSAIALILIAVIVLTRKKKNVPGS